MYLSTYIELLLKYIYTYQKLIFSLQCIKYCDAFPNGFTYIFAILLWCLCIHLCDVSRWTGCAPTQSIGLAFGHWPLTRIRKILRCACAGSTLNVFSVTYVPWCMSGSLTPGGGENVPGIPGARTTRNITYLVRGPSDRHCSCVNHHYVIQIL